MKKILLYFSLLMFFCINSVFAKPIQTYNGLEIEEEKYNTLVNIYGFNYIYFITEEEYNLIKNNDLSKIEQVVYDDEPLSLIRPFSTYSTSYKTISLTNNNNVITVKLKWKKNPKVRSYDVLGVRLQGLTLENIISFKQYYTENGTTKVSTNATLKRFNNGFGESFLLSDKDNLECTVTFVVNGSGKIFATYQHATSSVSLNDSTNYTLSELGLGSVLLFNNGIGEKYDRMAGVNINI